MPLVALLFLVGSVVAGIIVGAAVGRRDERERWTSALLAGRLPLGPSVEDVVRRQGPSDRAQAERDRLEESIDAIALEMERVAEGQRFLTKLLAERLGTPVPPAPQRERIVTPH